MYQGSGKCDLLEERQIGSVECQLRIRSPGGLVMHLTAHALHRWSPLQAQHSSSAAAGMNELGHACPLGHPDVRPVDPNPGNNGLGERELRGDEGYTNSLQKTKCWKVPGLSVTRAGVVPEHLAALILPAIPLAETPALARTGNPTATLASAHIPLDILPVPAESSELTSTPSPYQAAELRPLFMDVNAFRRRSE